MTTQLRLSWPIVAGLVVALAQGCGQANRQPAFSALHGHFGIATQPMDIDSGPGAELFYRGDDLALTLIWPFLGTRGYPILFEKDMAFFIAEMPDEQGRIGTGTYFAVDGPGPALDVSEDLLKLWAESNKLDFQSLRKHYAPLRVKEISAGFEVEYLQDEGVPEGKFVVTWGELAGIIRDVKATGTRYISYNSPVPYLCKDYGPPPRVSRQK